MNQCACAQTVLGGEITPADNHDDAASHGSSLQPKPKEGVTPSTSRPQAKQPPAAPPPPPPPPANVTAAPRARKAAIGPPASPPLPSSSSHPAAAARAAAVPIQTTVAGPDISRLPSGDPALTSAKANGPRALPLVPKPISSEATDAITCGAGGAPGDPGTEALGRLPHQPADRRTTSRACTPALLALLQVSKAKAAAQLGA